MLAGLARYEKAALYGAAFFFLLAGCATPDSFGGSRAAVIAWATDKGFDARDESVGGFRLLTMQRSQNGEKELAVYIEGDGAPWPSRYHPPRDPTPIRPVALALAAADPGLAVAYVGRPCQYLSTDELAVCSVAYWTSHRYAVDVLSAYDRVLDLLKQRTGASRLRLYGYSGGGVIAALLAQRRPDVVGLVTVAAPLALTAWTELHRVSKLTASIDPMDAPGNPSKAIHWAGGRDKIVPPAIIEAYANTKGGVVAVEASFDHECCWSRDWLRMLENSR